MEKLKVTQEQYNDFMAMKSTLIFDVDEARKNLLGKLTGDDEIDLDNVNDGIHSLFNYFNEYNVSVIVSKMPASLMLIDNGGKSLTKALVMRSIKCSIEDIKTMSRFISKKGALIIYKLYKNIEDPLFRFSYCIVDDMVIKSEEELEISE